MNFKNKKITLLLISTLFVILLNGCNSNSRYHFTNTNELKKEDAKNFIIEKSKIDTLSKIVISTRIGNIEFIEDDDYYIEIDYNYWKDEPDYKIEDGILTFSDKNTLPNSYSINYSIDNVIRVYLPGSANPEQINIETSSGDVSISSFATNKLDIKVSYGDLIIENAAAVKAKINLSSGKTKISDFNVGTLTYSNSYGNATFTDINSGTISLPTTSQNDFIEINMSSGQCSINGLQSDSLSINNSYGDVTCKNLIVNELTSSLSSGDLTISKSAIKDAKIKNSYGDVELSLTGKAEDHSLDLKTSYGSIKVDGRKYDNQLTRENNGANHISAKLSSGNIDISFE